MSERTEVRILSVIKMIGLVGIVASLGWASVALFEFGFFLPALIFGDGLVALFAGIIAYDLCQQLRSGQFS